MQVIKIVGLLLRKTKAGKSSLEYIFIYTKTPQCFITYILMCLYYYIINEQMRLIMAKLKFRFPIISMQALRSLKERVRVVIIDFINLSNRPLQNSCLRILLHKQHFSKKTKAPTTAINLSALNAILLRYT